MSRNPKNKLPIIETLNKNNQNGKTIINLIKGNLSINKRETPITYVELEQFGMSNVTSSYKGNLDKNWYSFSLSTGFKLFINKHTYEIHLSNDASINYGKIYSLEELALKLIRKDEIEPCDFYYENEILKIENDWN